MLIVALGASVAAAQSAKTLRERLVGTWSLVIAEITTADGTKIQIWDCSGGSNQAVTLTAAGELRLYGGAQCLDAYNNQTASGTKVELWTCNGGANQQWRLNPGGTVTGVQSGLCLDVSGASTANGAVAELWTCNGGSNQKWSRQ